jgi:hypothetical protein
MLTTQKAIEMKHSHGESGMIGDTTVAVLGRDESLGRTP